MTVHYIRLIVNSPFPALYYVLARKFGQCYRRCLKLENGKLYGIIIGEKHFFRIGSMASITVTLEERE